MKKILDDPELAAELDKAYKLAAPYRSKVQHKLTLINQCTIFQGSIYLLDTLMVNCFVNPVYIHPDLKV